MPSIFPEILENVYSHGNIGLWALGQNIQHDGENGGEKE